MTVDAYDQDPFTPATQPITREADHRRAHVEGDVARLVAQLVGEETLRERAGAAAHLHEVGRSVEVPGRYRLAIATEKHYGRSARQQRRRVR